MAEQQYRNKVESTKSNLTGLISGPISEQNIFNYIYQHRMDDSKLKTLSGRVEQCLLAQESLNAYLDIEIKETLDKYKEGHDKRLLDDWNDEKQNYKKYFNRLLRWGFSSFLIILGYSIAVSATKDSGFWKIPAKDTIEKFAPKD